MPSPRKAARRPFHLMAKPTGSRCNLACDYCFYLGKGVATPAPGARPERHMDDATLEAFVRGYIEANPAADIEFTWQGGEPTLAGIDFYRKALALQARYAGGKTIRNAMQTNGILIDARWAEFLADNRVLVGISIDGPERLHDAHRKTAAGKGVHAAVLRGLDHLKAAGVDFNILAVVNAATAEHPRETYRYLSGDLGAAFIQFIPALAPAPAGEAADARASWPVSGEAYGRFVIGVFDDWVRRDVGRVYVQLFDNALAAWTGQRASLCVMRPTCGDALVIEQNGDVYSCDHWVDAAHRLGNIRRDSLAAMVDGRRQKAFGMAKAALPGECIRCPWRFACHGGCPAHRIHRAGDDGRNHLCAGYKAMFAHMDPYMRYMASQLRQGRPPAAIMAVASAIAAAARPIRDPIFPAPPRS